MRSRRAIELLVVVIAVLALRAWQHRDVVNGSAPALTGTTLDGASIGTNASGNQPVLVHFWATWCSICRLEQSSIVDVADAERVITVAMQSGDDDEVRRHLQKHNLTFPVLNDPDGDIARAWGVHVVPASFIVDGAGNIRFVEIGYTTEWGLRLRMWLTRLLG